MRHGSLYASSRLPAHLWGCLWVAMIMLTACAGWASVQHLKAVKDSCAVLSSMSGCVLSHTTSNPAHHH
jgi:hypothetical protein